MDEFEKLFSDEFFIIDSDNLSSVESKLYGFCISNNKVIFNEDFNKKDFSLRGSFVYVDKVDDTISIYQDFDGSYGIYLYQTENYFCISNSFMKLVDYLKYNHPLSLNMDFAKAYLGSSLCSYFYKKTLVNEIICLPRIFILNIDINKKHITFDRINYGERSIPIASKEALDVLDNWFFKWTSLFNNLKAKTNNIIVDLSGGFDSRIALLLILNSGINLNEISFRSANDGLHVHNEDYRIASEIANEFNFELNNFENETSDKYYFEEIETTLKISFYIKGGFHNQLHYKEYKNLDHVYSVTGYGGGIIRGWGESKDSIINRAKMLSEDLAESTRKMLEYNEENIKLDFNIGMDDFPSINYRETRRRNHFSKANVEKFLSNIISLNPIMDMDLCKINIFDDLCDDTKLLLAIIFLRYYPKLLEFDFEGNRIISKDTLIYASKINGLKPFVSNSNFLFNSDSDVDIGQSQKYKNKCNINKPIQLQKKIESLLRKTYFSDLFKYSFSSYFSSQIYDKNALNFESHGFFPLQYIYPSLFIMKIISDANIFKYGGNNLHSWFNKFLDFPSYNSDNYKVLAKLMKYNTARIDIINNGENCSIEFIDCTDVERVIRRPSWIKPSNGGGIIIESFKNSFDLKFKCIGDGKLKISLRGKDIRDKHSNRFPIYIDFTKFHVNNTPILNQNKLVWHDAPYSFTKDVIDGEIVSIHVEWDPFTNSSVYTN